MLLGDVFDRFAAESPVSVMARAAFEHALPADAVDELFAEHAERQYTRELLFSQLVDLMGPVVCRVQPSLNAAIRKRADALGVTRKAVWPCCTDRSGRCCTAGRSLFPSCACRGSSESSSRYSPPK